MYHVSAQGVDERMIKLMYIIIIIIIIIIVVVVVVLFSSDIMAVKGLSPTKEREQNEADFSVPVARPNYYVVTVYIYIYIYIYISLFVA